MILILKWFLILSLMGCGHIQSRKDLKLENATAAEPEQQRPEEVPQPQEKEPSKLGVILGPGSVKAFAHTGLIKELTKAGIPISYLVGIEWGALVGGLFAINGKINDTEWKLYKLQARELNKSNWFSDENKNFTVQEYRDFFSQNFAEHSMNNLAVPFACPSVSIWSGVIVWQETGPLRKAVERCMPSPPLFKPKGPWMAAMFSSQEAIDFLRKKGMNVILFVDVLGKSQPLSTKELMTEYTSALLWHQLKKEISNTLSTQQVLKINVNTLQFHLYDFSARSSLVSSGVQAGQKVVEELIKKYDF